MQTMAITPWRQQHLWVQRGSKSPNSLFTENSLYIWFSFDFFFLFFSRFRVESFSKTMHEHESQLSSHNSWNFYARLHDAIHCLLFNSHISSHRYIGQCLAACNRIEATKFQKHANKSTLEIRKSILLYSWSRTSIMVQGHHDIVGSLNSAFAWTIKNPVVPIWSNAQICKVIRLVLCLGLINALSRILQLNLIPFHTLSVGFKGERV